MCRELTNFFELPKTEKKTKDNNDTSIKRSSHPDIPRLGKILSRKLGIFRSASVAKVAKGKVSIASIEILFFISV